MLIGIQSSPFTFDSLKHMFSWLESVFIIGVMVHLSKGALIPLHLLFVGI